MLRPGQAIALCVLALLTLGVVMVNSAGMSVDPKQAVTIQSILLSRSAVYMGVALLAMLVCAHLPIRRVLPVFERNRSNGSPTSEPETPALTLAWFRALFERYLSLWPLWVCVLGLLGVMALVYIPGIGREVNGSHRWISLHVRGLESIQPSELAKWGLVVLIAWYGATQAGLINRFWRGLTPALAAAGLLAVFIIKEDLGTGVLLGAVTCVMLIAAGARVWHIAVVAPAPIAAVVAAIATSNYRRDRMLAFLDPYADPQGIGYHMIQSMVAVANGRVFGRGLGFGLQKFGYLPADKTDFVFAIICEELGISGAALVAALFGGLLWACWSVIRRERSPLLRLLGLGVVATIGIQALINLAVVTGLGPTKGIALPFLSSGGTGWILTAASLGLIIAMDRTFVPMARVPRSIDASAESQPPLVEPKPVPPPIEVCAEVDEQPAESVAQLAEAPTEAAEPWDADNLSEDLIIGPAAEVASLTEPAPAPEMAAIFTTVSLMEGDESGQGLLFAAGVQPEHEMSPPGVVVTDDAREWAAPQASGSTG